MIITSEEGERRHFAEQSKRKASGDGRLGYCKKIQKPLTLKTQVRSLKESIIAKTNQIRLKSGDNQFLKSYFTTRPQPLELRIPENPTLMKRQS